MSRSRWRSTTSRLGTDRRQETGAGVAAIGPALTESEVPAIAVASHPAEEGSALSCRSQTEPRRAESSLGGQAVGHVAAAKLIGHVDAREHTC
jgi:hypothetical protein